MTHTRGNRCHLATWIETVTPRWPCILYNMNMHLQQMPWAHIHATRSRAPMTREGCSCNHESPSYKVNNHPHTRKHIYIHIYIYIYTYIYHAQCYHTESKSKTDIANSPRVWPNKVQEMSNKHYHIQGMRPKQRARKRKGTSKGGTLIHTLLKRFRERERKKKPPRKG